MPVFDAADDFWLQRHIPSKDLRWHLRKVFAEIRETLQNNNVINKDEIIEKVQIWASSCMVQLQACIDQKELPDAVIWNMMEETMTFALEHKWHEDWRHSDDGLPPLQPYMDVDTHQSPQQSHPPPSTGTAPSGPFHYSFSQPVEWWLSNDARCSAPTPSSSTTRGVKREGLNETDPLVLGSDSLQSADPMDVVIETSPEKCRTKKSRAEPIIEDEKTKKLKSSKNIREAAPIDSPSQLTSPPESTVNDDQVNKIKKSKKIREAPPIDSVSQPTSAPKSTANDEQTKKAKKSKKIREADLIDPVPQLASAPEPTTNDKQKKKTKELKNAPEASPIAKFPTSLDISLPESSRYGLYIRHQHHQPKVDSTVKDERTKWTKKSRSLRKESPKPLTIPVVLTSRATPPLESRRIRQTVQGQHQIQSIPKGPKNMPAPDGAPLHPIPRKPTGGYERKPSPPARPLHINVAPSEPTNMPAPDGAPLHPIPRKPTGGYERKPLPPTQPLHINVAPSEPTNMPRPIRGPFHPILPAWPMRNVAVERSRSLGSMFAAIRTIVAAHGPVAHWTIAFYKLAVQTSQASACVVTSAPWAMIT
ncbi:hypothetical protein K402DRAFT_465535 [Aulographum hederae CBS 113979]|uniref:Uncharacterized protein n=1 Tax=Aulographum hederae CBS 113979 TaxID=1176131 RepID=A0A6G1GSE9_9PEZI|nr:hypothetical protein K402DRAFT_465535 [Aulographum hederae CBS 113979]